MSKQAQVETGRGQGGDQDVRQRLSLAGRRTIVMTAAPLAVSLVTQVLVGRHVGRIGFGEYHALGLFVIILTSLGPLGSPAAVSQRIAELEPAASLERAAATRTAFAVAVGLATLLAAVAWVAWPAYAALFGLAHTVLSALVALATFTSVLATFAIHSLVARLEVNEATVVILAQPLAVAAGILASFVGGPFDGASLAALGFIGSGTIGALHFIRLGAVPIPAREELRLLVDRSVHATILAYPSVVSGWVDRAIVGTLLGPAALGAFVAANTFVEGVQRFTRGIGAMAVPAYARLVEDPPGARRVLDSHLRIMATLFIVSSTVFIAAGGGILGLLFGQGFVIAATTLRLLAIGLLPVGLAVALASQTVGSGGSPGLTRVLLLLVPLQLVAAYLGAYYFHIAGVALADVVVWTIGLVLYVARAKQEGAPIQIRTLAHIAGVAVPLFLAGWVIGVQPISWPLAALVAFAAAAPISGIVLVRRPEVRIIRRVLRPDVTPV